MITFVIKDIRNVMAAEQTEGWHPEDIKAEVRKKGTTLSKLATDHGGAESLCRAALRRPSPQGEKIIAAFLNIPLQVLWPERYAPNGDRVRHVRDETNQNRDRAHRQIEGAR